MQPTVSILKETRDQDRRVILLPPAVRRFRDSGFRVFVEHDAGVGCGATDQDYAAAGAQIVSTAEAWSCSPFVLKYKCPSVAERSYLTRPMHICAHFYPGENYELTQHLCAHKVTAYSYEYFKADDGSFPLMTPDSEIAGRLAILFGARQLQSTRGGLGILLASIPGIKPPKVVVIGHGNAGGAAARTAAALGNEVVVFGHRAESLRRFQATVAPGVRCLLASPDSDGRPGRGHDPRLHVRHPAHGHGGHGQAHAAGIDDPGRHLRLRRRVIPTAHRLTRLGGEPYLVHGVWHYKDPVMPTQVHLTSAQAASQNHAPYLINLGKSIFDPRARDPVSQRAKFTDDGRVVHPDVLSDFAMIEEAQRKDSVAAAG
jgi:alanine dehydrogenase